MLDPTLRDQLIAELQDKASPLRAVAVEIVTQDLVSDPDTPARYQDGAPRERLRDLIATVMRDKIISLVRDGFQRRAFRGY